MFHVPENYRLKQGAMSSDYTFGNNGAFIVPYRIHGIKQTMFVIASDQLGWEHVSVSREDRTPVWEEMCIVKDLFWDKEDCVIQYHPPHSEYVNNHLHCLHLWRPVGVQLPMPDSILVGVKDVDR